MDRQGEAVKRVIWLPLILIGCRVKSPEPVVVKIPVPVECPKVVMPPRPNLPKIEDGDDVATMAKKLAVGNAMLVDHYLILEKLLAPFSKPAPVIKPLNVLPPDPQDQRAKL